MVSLVWFREDLRVRDNAALADAAARGAVLPVYCFDPRADDSEGGIFGLPKRGARRARFRLESVRDLRTQLRERGADLLVRRGKPEDVLPELAREFGAEACFYSETPATEERAIERAVRESLPESVVAEPRWTKTLHHRADLPTPVADIPDTFTPWKEEVENDAGAEPRDVIPAPDALDSPDADGGDIPSLAELGHRVPERDERAAFAYRGGSAAARERVAEWVWEGDNLRAYAETRNGLHGPDYASRFSAWLADGSISPRELYAEAKKYEAERVANKSTYWLVFELRWRDFMTFQFEKHGAQFFSPGGIRERNIEWSRDSAAFTRWQVGETGVPFVDAGMRELRETGYLSNRLRQNVASFLANDLGVDWRLGAAHFEAELIDYDVCSNWGNWAYQAGVGNDSRDRSFDVLSQAKRYDDDAAYVKRWCPELSGLITEYAHEPWRMSADEQERYGVELGQDYSRPMEGLGRYIG
jgi:deoxyribodipyrimidine photo-lyase